MDITHVTTLAYDLKLPAKLGVPLVVDSPHSWKDYPQGFTPICSRDDLLTGWDAWVDELFGSAPEIGAPLLSARFPRFFLDLNRARDDIDPDMVAGTLPFSINPTKKSEKGFGLLRRYALPSVPVYDGPLEAAELIANIETYYDPYHSALADLIDETARQFGRAVHLDCHSMKSRGNAMNDDNGRARPDIVVSDICGTTAHSAMTENLARLFRGVGLKTQINDPYQGAELISRHARPEDQRHSIQIEINRALYMNENELEKSANFGVLKMQIDEVLRDFSREI